jgi:hypothetical protein
VRETPCAQVEPGAQEGPAARHERIDFLICNSLQFF